MSHTLAQRHVDVGDEAAGHGVDRRVETRQRGGQQADDHNAPHARRDRAADVLREDVARVVLVLHDRRRVGARRIGDVEQQSDREEDQHDGQAQYLRIDQRHARLLHRFAGQLPLHEFVVGRKLGELEDRAADERAHQIIGHVHAPRRIDDLQLVACDPLARRILDFARSERSEDVAEAHVGRHREIDEQQRHDARADDQHDLDRIDVDQPLDAARHGVNGTDDTQNDDRIHQELELDAAVENHRHGDRGDEEPRTRREELPDEEHDARRILGRIAEAVAQVAVNGDRIGVVEFRQHQQGHERAAEDRPDAEHQVGQVGIEPQFGRADEGARADRGSRGGEGHEPRRHRAAAQKIVFEIPVAFREKEADQGQSDQENGDDGPVDKSHSARFRSD